MTELRTNLNRLAGTSDLDAQGAANAFAGTTQRDLVGALNAVIGTTGIELNGVIKRLASIFNGDSSLDLGDALDTAMTFFPSTTIFPELNRYPGVI